MSTEPVEATDARDLREYARTGSSEAFGRLVARHTGLVFSACLRRLGSREDAEDASQSVFLALARKAGSLQPGGLRSWLHGVAVRTAAFLVRSRARRARREKEVAAMESAPAPTAGWEEVRPRLDLELSRLPTKLRDAVTGHYLAGRTRAELAREMGVPEGTVQSRLQAGLERLRLRLARHAAMPSLAALGAMLTANCLEPVPAGLGASIRAMCLGGAAASPVALAAADGVLRAMAWAKVKTAVLVAALTAAAGVSGALALGPVLSGSRPPAAPEAAGRLRDLPEDSWLKLDPPREPLSRTFSGCCFGGGRLWYFGGGHHSWKGNDVELYDPAANEWRRVTSPEWPAQGTAAWNELTNLSDGTAQLSGSGRPYAEHTFQQVCWDPAAGKFVAVLRCSGTWEFDPGSARWTRLVETAPNGAKLPYQGIAATLAIYDPSLGAPVAVLTGGRDAGVFALSSDRRGWRRLGDLPPELRDGTLYATYIPDWKAHLVSCLRTKGAGGWFRLKLDPLAVSPIPAAAGPQPSAALACDSGNGVVIVAERREIADRTFAPRLWALAPASLEWTELQAHGPIPTDRNNGAWAPLWFDARHGVFLFLNNVAHGPTLDGGLTETWAYRYRKPAGER